MNGDDKQDIDVLVEMGAYSAVTSPSNEVLKSPKLKTSYLASLARESSALKSPLTP